jgi:hypothetical protein
VPGVAGVLGALHRDVAAGVGTDDETRRSRNTSAPQQSAGDDSPRKPSMPGYSGTLGSLPAATRPVVAGCRLRGGEPVAGGDRPAAVVLLASAPPRCRT